VSIAGAIATIGRIAVPALTCLTLTGIAEAHPHVWITVTEELIYAPDGRVAAVRHIWTFDDMFSAFAIRGVEQKTPGILSREDLAQLAKDQIDGLKDYAYFTHPKLDGERRPDAFDDPTDSVLEYDPKQASLTLSFTLPFKTPMQAGALEIDIFDPQLFFYLSFAKMAPVRLVGAPQDCVPTLGGDANKSDADTEHRSAGVVATSTRQIWVKCP
jgi:ABC-type uncharacterized transport system substrate-binding protein